jgi:predicted GNAT family acetyltransferase
MYVSIMHALDNVIWNALTTSQAQFAQSSALARRFPEDVSVFGGVREDSEEAYRALAQLTRQRPVGLFFEQARIPSGWTAAAMIELVQMVCENGCPLRLRPSDSPCFVELTAREAPEMLALAALTKPGPFSRHTHQLGRYIGIPHTGNLVAMAGERLCVPGYTEVSAVCTHPDHLGRGYARLLVTELMQRIVQRGEQPFLHVRNENTRAIELYRRLGFRERAQLYYAMIERDGMPRKIKSEAPGQ